MFSTEKANLLVASLSLAALVDAELFVLLTPLGTERVRSTGQTW